MSGGRERRRLARIPLKCTVVVREKLATTVAETEDVGARGCRILLRRPAAPGTLLLIRFAPAGGADPLDAVGQVVWARKTPPLSAGVVFVSAPRAAMHDPGGNWLEVLLASQLRRVATGELDLGELAKVQLQLRVDPRLVAPKELAALRVARDGGTVDAVATSLGGLEPLAALLERGVVIVARAAASGHGVGAAA